MNFHTFLMVPKRVILFSLFALSFLGWAGAAHARIDTTCLNEDCFVYGWENEDYSTRQISTVECRNNDCLYNGWANVYKSRLIGEVFCKADGCFNEGWTVHDTRTGRVVADVSCQTSFATSDCLQFGWVTSEPGRAPYVTRCVNGDCRNIGWDVRLPGANPLPVRCKPGGCFKTGWVTYN